MIMAVSRKASDPKSPVLKIGTPGCFDRAQHWSEAGPQGNRRFYANWSIFVAIHNKVGRF